MELKPIGVIKSPYKKRGDAPRQGSLSKEEMVLVIDEVYVEGMKGLESIKHIVVLYWGDRSDRSALLTTPPGREDETGVFSCRSPNRPNPIALNVAEIINIKGNEIRVVGLDAFDGSPLLDIKPHMVALDNMAEKKA